MSALLGLSPQTLARIRAVLAEHPGVEQAILYGSRALGTYHTGSDIDLTLKGEGLALAELLKIADELDELMLPYKIDLSLLHQLDNPQLIEHIRRVGVTIYPMRAHSD